MLGEIIVKKWLSVSISLILCTLLFIPLVQAEEKVAVIVTIDKDAILEYAGVAAYSTGAVEVENEDIVEYAVAEAQNICEFETDYTYSEVLLGFSAEIDKSDIDELSSLPYVEKVVIVPQIVISNPEENGEITDNCCSMIDIPYAHGLGYNGKGMLVAVIDTGFDYEHEFFKSSVEGGKITDENYGDIYKNISAGISSEDLFFSSKLPFVYNYVTGDGNTNVSSSLSTHGTHVAGIAGGKNGTYDGKTLNGAASEAQLALMAVGQGGSLSPAAVLAACDDAVKIGADVVNLSFGIPYGEMITMFDEAIYNLNEAGIMVYAAAGNDARGLSDGMVLPADTDYSEYSSPASSSGVMSVANAASVTQMRSNSGWGTGMNLELKPDITGPGNAILSSFPGDKYSTLGGTSMAVPHLSGAAAVIKQYVNTLKEDYRTPLFAENLMMSGAQIVRFEDTGIPYSPRNQGAGLVNVKNSLLTPAVLKGDKGNSKISLGENINNEFELKFAIENFTDEDVTYDEITVEVITDGTSVDGYGNTIIGDMVRLEHTHNAPKSVTVGAYSSESMSITVKPDEAAVKENLEVFKNGFYIDGFVIFSKTDDSLPEISIPFTGYYGDWEKAPVIDSPWYDENSSYAYTRLASKYSSQTCSCMETTEICWTLGRNIYADLMASEDKTFDSWVYASGEYQGYSPNGDGAYDFLCIDTLFLRAFNKYIFSVKDAEGNIIKEVTDDEFENAYTKYTIYCEDFYDEFADGDYTAEISAVYASDSVSTQTVVMPFYVDTQRPVVKTAVSADNGAKMLTVTAADNRYVMGAEITGAYEDGSEAYLYLPAMPSESAVMEFDITGINEKSIRISVSDYACNYTTVSLGGIDAVIDDAPVYSEDGAQLTVSIINSTGKDIVGDIAVAVYNSDGSMSEARMLKNETMKSGISHKNFEFNNLSKDKKIKVIIMAPDGSLKPLGIGEVFYVDKLS